MAAPGPDLSPAVALPVITFSDTTTFHYNGHEIHAFHPVNAHTDGDAIIHFRDLDIIHSGDLLFNGLYPFIDLDSGGTIDGYIQGLSQLIELAGPETRIIPGHGPMATREDVEKAKAMLSDARSRVATLIARGKSLDDVKAIDPLSIYHSDWSWAFINGERMTETLYIGLKAPAESRKP
jgi:glyoxylase-like metal-dependent hydrolase (beta-lactamase superfamily II)